MILDAAAQVFDREGETATTNRIADRAGVSIGSVYQYFPDKLAILDALAARHLCAAGSELGVVFARLRADAPPFEETMRAVLEPVVAAHAGHPRLHWLLHRLAPRSFAELAAVRAFEDWLTDEIGFHLRRCGRDGGDPDHTARLVVHTVDAQLHRGMTLRGFSVDGLLDLVERLVPASAG